MPGWASLLLLAATWISGDQVPPQQRSAQVEAFLRKCEENRRGTLLQLEHQLRGLRSQAPRSAEAARAIPQLEKVHKRLAAGTELLVPALSFPAEVGAIGRLPRTACHIEQVISANEMLVRADFPVRSRVVRNYQARSEKTVQAISFLVRGVATADRHEGSDCELGEVYEIAGRESYRTIDGGRRTAWVLVPFDVAGLVPASSRGSPGRD